jgi:hypothetical protein
MVAMKISRPQNRLGVFIQTQLNGYNRFKPCNDRITGDFYEEKDCIPSFCNQPCA